MKKPTLENIVKKSCATKEIKNRLESMYKKSMEKSERENDIEHHKSELLADLCNMLNIKIKGYRSIMDKYGGE